MIDKANAFQLILNGSLSDGCQDQYGNCNACRNQIGGEDVVGCEYSNISLGGL